MKKVLKVHNLALLMVLMSAFSFAIADETQEIIIQIPEGVSNNENKMPYKSIITHNLLIIRRGEGTPNLIKCEYDRLGRQCRVMLAQGGGDIDKRI